MLGARSAVETMPWIFELPTAFFGGTVESAWCVR